VCRGSDPPRPRRPTTAVYVYVYVYVYVVRNVIGGETAGLSLRLP